MTPRLLALVLGLALPASAAAGDEPIPVPSGQTVTFIEMIHDSPGPEGLTYRFRFLAPAIAREGGTISDDQAFEDMAVLCEAFALPRLATTGPQPSQIVISLSDRPVAFAEPDPEATQYFEAYRPDGALCIWEGF